MKAIFHKLVIFSFLLFPLLSLSQTRKITGTVLSFNKYPVSNVTVKAKKAKTEVITSESGEFELEVKNNDVIRIKEPVFFEYNQKITEDIKNLKINLIFDNSGRNLDKAAEAGYISRDKLEYGLEHLYKENNVYANFVNVYDAIKYALPEVSLIVENGQRGVQFRGAKTVTGSNAALLVVDGVIVEDVSFISPVNIVSISKLSNASSALYGARAANGVIFIETQ